MATDAEALLAYSAAATQVVHVFQAGTLSFITDTGVAVMVRKERHRLVIETDLGGAPLVLHSNRDLSRSQVRLTGQVSGPASSLPTIFATTNHHGLVDRCLLNLDDDYIEFDVATDQAPANATTVAPWATVSQSQFVQYRGTAQVIVNHVHLTEHGVFSFFQNGNDLRVERLDHTDSEMTFEGGRLARVGDFLFAVSYPGIGDRIHIYDYQFQRVAVAPSRNFMYDNGYLRSGDMIANLPARSTIVLPHPITGSDRVIYFSTNSAFILFVSNGPLMIAPIDGGVANQLTVGPAGFARDAHRRGTESHQVYPSEGFIRYLRHDERGVVEVVEIRYAANVQFLP